jgi:hypothetical protein
VAVGDEGAAGECFARLALRPRQPEHGPDRDCGQYDADRARVRPVLRGERPDRLERDVGGEDRERDADQALRSALDLLDPFLVCAAAGLGPEAPKEDRAGDRLDEAVDAEADEGDAPGGETGTARR